MIYDIRPAVPDDADAIGYVHATSWKETYAGLIDEEFLAAMSPEKSAGRFQELGVKDTLVLTVEGRVVGFSVAVNATDDDLPWTYGDIKAIYILKEYQKLGFGRGLLQASIDKLRREGFDDIAIWVLDTNKNAVAFYEKCGFFHDGTSKEVMYNTPVTCKRFLLKCGECI